MQGVADLWREANAALPPGWELQGLRCACIGIAPHETCEGWVAEACGPDGGCERIQHESPMLALTTLTRRLRGRRA